MQDLSSLVPDTFGVHGSVNEIGGQELQDAALHPAQSLDDWTDMPDTSGTVSPLPAGNPKSTGAGQGSVR